MKAIVVMFDTSSRHYLPCYGNEWVKAPNLERLARQAVTFDTSHVCSMPCMPARRDDHTGRPNFLHRSSGPLEPFDDSMPKMLSDAGVHTHEAAFQVESKAAGQHWTGCSCANPHNPCSA